MNPPNAEHAEAGVSAGGQTPVAIPLSREPQELGTAPVVRRFLVRYGPGYGVTSEGLAAQLGLDEAELARYTLGAAATPRWLPLALAGVGTAYGVPAEELRWLVTPERPEQPRHGAQVVGGPGTGSGECPVDDSDPSPFRRVE